MNQETLLIVEDNPVLREGLQEILSMEGYTVFTAGHGREALQLLNQMKGDHPALILSDIAMPEMDGYALLNAVRASSDWLDIPFIFLTARGNSEDVLASKDLGVEDYLVKPLSRKELVTAVQARLGRARQISMAQLQTTYESSLVAMATAIDLRDPYSRGRLERVTANTLAMAVKLGWSEDRLEQLRFGAILHDIGKISIRESIMLKAGPLSDEEWHEIKRHPDMGARMVKDVPYLSPVIPVIRCHHERWDGKGYPDGLAGEAIPEEARIVAIADSYDAMTAGRPYKPAVSQEQAREEIRYSAGKQYDGDIVAAFELAYEEELLQAAAPCP